MPLKIRGFSLIEALIAVLVLAIGFVGLGQLQSRLWISAGERHTEADALLVAGNLVEHGRSAQPANAASIPAINPKNRTFTTNLTMRKRGNITDIQSLVGWSARAGQPSIQLQSSLYSAGDIHAARWLLPSPILWSLPGN